MSLQTAKIKVREIKCKETSVFIIEQKADFQDSKSLLTERGMRLLSKEEALAYISKTPELKNQLKDKWFYLDGRGFGEDSMFTFDEKGTLIEKNQEQIKKEKISPEKLVRTFSGKQPLALYLWPDDFVSVGYRRFGLFANVEPQSIASLAPLVLGVKQGEPKIALEEPKIALEEPKIAPELLAEFRTVVAKLDATAQAGVINPEIAETTKKILRALE